MLGKFVLYFSESMSMEFNWILEITKLKKRHLTRATLPLLERSGAKKWDAKALSMYLER